MDAARFRKLALALPEAVEGSHQGHADFRVGGKVFASLGPDERWAMLRLPLPLQAELVDAFPDVFEPFAGAWGRQGCTKVLLAAAPLGRVRPALLEAWRHRAPPKLLEEGAARGGGGAARSGGGAARSGGRAVRGRASSGARGRGDDAARSRAGAGAPARRKPDSRRR
jgi:hypothetical protein